MGDWDFLHDMYNDGYSAEQIADAAACGYNPWEWQPLDEIELPELCQQASPELTGIFESLVDSAKQYHTLTGRYLQIWGELGELYAEIKYSIKRHKPHTRVQMANSATITLKLKPFPQKKLGSLLKLSELATSISY